MGRPYADAREAIQRVEGEGAVPLEELTTLAGAGAGSLLRWAVMGKRVGDAVVYLDAIFHRRNGWKSSAAAVARFLAATRRRDGAA